jgi:hypothetical protein
MAFFVYKNTYLIGLLVGLLISAPDASLSAGVPGGASSALKHLRGLPSPVFPQESSHLPLQSKGCQINLKNCTHFFRFRKLRHLFYKEDFFLAMKNILSDCSCGSLFSKSAQISSNSKPACSNHCEYC